MRPLIRVDARDPATVTAALARALSGDGPAVLPTAGAVPETSPGEGAGESEGEGAGALGPVPSDVVLVIETSGSTAEPKRVLLTADALRASAAATYARFDELFGGGQPIEPTRQWLLTLPASYVAGAQVLMRSLLAGTEPVAFGDDHFTAEGFARAAAKLTADRRYVSLVPAQLARLLDAAEAEAVEAEVVDSEASGAEATDVETVGAEATDADISGAEAADADITGAEAADADTTGAEATDADTPDGPDSTPSTLAGAVASVVARFDAILVGGQSLPPALRARAAALGWNLATSYGSSETSGGCLYDGVPLDGVRVRIRDGEVQLAGPVLAAGYLDDPRRTAEAFVEEDGERWYRTSDGGRLESDEATGRERLVVTGRLDNVIVSGGEKVLLDRVEGIVRQLHGLEGAVVVAAPSEEWGQVPALVVDSLAWHGPEGASGAAATLVDAYGLSGDARWLAVRDATLAAGRAARPAKLLVVDRIPHLPSGKPDRRSLERLVAQLA